MSVNTASAGAGTCGAVRHRLAGTPPIVHCCHCSWCQRGTGSACVINAMIEADRVELLPGQPTMVDTPSASGKGQRIARCMQCHVAWWSHYPGGGKAVAFVRGGTLAEPWRRIPPNLNASREDGRPSANRD